MNEILVLVFASTTILCLGIAFLCGMAVARASRRATMWGALIAMVIFMGAMVVSAMMTVSLILMPR